MFRSEERFVMDYLQSLMWWISYHRHWIFLCDTINVIKVIVKEACFFSAVVVGNVMMKSLIKACELGCSSFTTCAHLLIIGLVMVDGGVFVRIQCDTSHLILG